MSSENRQLETELEALPWMESKFKPNSMWIPKNVVPKNIKAALERHNGRFYGEDFIYYLSKSGVISKYSKSDVPVEERVEFDPNYKVQVDTKEEPPLCPECGEPMDREHRGKHNHV